MHPVLQICGGPLMHLLLFGHLLEIDLRGLQLPAQLLRALLIVTKLTVDALEQSSLGLLLD